MERAASAVKCNCETRKEWLAADHIELRAAAWDPAAGARHQAYVIPAMRPVQSSYTLFFSFLFFYFYRYLVGMNQALVWKGRRPATGELTVEQNKVYMNKWERPRGGDARRNGRQVTHISFHFLLLYSRFFPYSGICFFNHPHTPLRRSLLHWALAKSGKIN